jgi:hypothetical protein
MLPLFSPPYRRSNRLTLARIGMLLVPLRREIAMLGSKAAMLLIRRMIQPLTRNR